MQHTANRGASVLHHEQFYHAGLSEIGDFCPVWFASRMVNLATVCTLFRSDGQGPIWSML